MQLFFWIAFLVVIGVAIFAVQNSDAPPVMVKFLVWKFETSLVYTILESICLGILFTPLESPTFPCGVVKLTPQGGDEP